MPKNSGKGTRKGHNEPQDDIDFLLGKSRISDFITPLEIIACSEDVVGDDILELNAVWILFGDLKWYYPLVQIDTNSLEVFCYTTLDGEKQLQDQFSLCKYTIKNNLAPSFDNG